MNTVSEKNRSQTNVLATITQQMQLTLLIFLHVTVQVKNGFHGLLQVLVINFRIKRMTVFFTQLMGTADVKPVWKYIAKNCNKS